jgi:cytochrome c-type biogenesis protein CcmH
MGSMALLIGIFSALLAMAAGFALWPVLRAPGRSWLARGLLGAATLAFILGAGSGLYLIFGAPQLALRTVSPPEAGGLPGLVARLAQRMRERPGDAAGWVLLGRGYLTLNDPQDAAAAFRRAVAVAPPEQRSGLFSSYGEALAMAAGGAVTPEAEAAFRAALVGNPKDFAARYYLGQAYAARRDNTAALAMWRSLLADAPPGAPWRGLVIDRVASLTAQAGQAPDIAAMVERLAARLKSQPADAEGWQRLMRAYAVLGDAAKARSALGEARTALKNDPTALSALADTARSLHLAE